MKQFQNMEKFLSFLTSEERNSHKFGNLMISENIVREEQQPTTSSQNQAEATTKPK